MFGAADLAQLSNISFNFLTELSNAPNVLISVSSSRSDDAKLALQRSWLTIPQHIFEEGLRLVFYLYYQPYLVYIVFGKVQGYDPTHLCVDFQDFQFSQLYKKNLYDKRYSPKWRLIHHQSYYMSGLYILYPILSH